MSENNSNRKCAGDIYRFGMPLSSRVKNLPWKGNLYLKKSNIVSLKGSPRYIGLDFDCSENELDNLVGGPDEVGKDYIAKNSNLKSLKGSPSEVGEDFLVQGNQLSSLKYCPKKVQQLDCSCNKISEIDYFPKEIKSFICRGNELKSLKGLPKIFTGTIDVSENLIESFYGCPEVVNDVFDCSENNITSLEGCPKTLKMFSVFKNKITNLHDIHKHIHSCKNLNLIGNPIESCILGLLKIENLVHICCDIQEIESIINKYLPLGDIFACQSELIEAGFDEFAKL